MQYINEKIDERSDDDILACLIVISVMLIIPLIIVHHWTFILIPLIVIPIIFMRRVYHDGGFIVKPTARWELREKKIKKLLK